MREPKEIQIDVEGQEKTFTIHKFSAYDGREFITQYPATGVPKIGDYKANEALSIRMMKYVTTKVGDREIQLSTKALIDNHCLNWETVMQLEKELMVYNCSFFQGGKASDLFAGFIKTGQELLSKTLMDSLQQLSQQIKQP